jgi:osmoprotectant transport system substrate-binding protein
MILLRSFPTIVIAAGLALAACGSAGTSFSTAGPASAAPVTASPPAASGASAAAGVSKPVIRVGSTNFAEQAALGELYAQLVEGLGYKVERKFNLGTREVVFPALESGQIDLEADYLATLLLFVDKNAKPASDAAQMSQALQQALAPKKITALQYAPAVDTNGFVVSQATSEKYNIRKLSDLQPVAAQFILGGAPECPQRPFCLRGLEDVYGLKFRDFKPLDTGGPITVQAVEGGQVQVAEMFTTDAQIQVHNFVLLEDDKHLQQADNVVPIIRDAVLDGAGSDLKTTINGIAPKITTAELTELNKAVGVDKKDPKDVVRAWLAANRPAS